MINKRLFAFRAWSVTQCISTVDTKATVDTLAIHLNKFLNKEGFHEMALTIETNEVALQYHKRIGEKSTYRMIELAHSLNAVLATNKAFALGTLHSCHILKALIAVKNILQNEGVIHSLVPLSCGKEC